MSEGLHQQVPRSRLSSAVRLAAFGGLGMVLSFVAGFFVFLGSLERAEPVAIVKADGIVALTGGADRIPDAVGWLAQGRGERLLISGVGSDISVEQLVSKVPRIKRWAGCCIDLDHQARNTEGNAAEARRWAHAKGYRSLVVVTSSYHMPRAMIELKRHMPGVRLVPAPVVTDRLQGLDFFKHPDLLKTIAYEYTKFLAAYARASLTPTAAMDDMASVNNRRRA